MKELLSKFHEEMQKRVKKSRKIDESIILENRIFATTCMDYMIEPRRCAQLLNDTYHYALTGDDVIEVFKKQKIANPIRRKKLFQWAEKVADCFMKAMQGQKDAYFLLEQALTEKETFFNEKKHISPERIIAIMLYEKYPELNVYDDKKSLVIFGNTYAKYYFYSMLDTLKVMQIFETKTTSTALERNLTYEQALQKITLLENNLARTDSMLQELQNEFEEQLEENKIKELTDFFAMLNSEKYGCILDELLVAKKGMDDLRKSHYELPIEINGLFIMIKKLIQFVRDNHIEPMMKMNAVIEAKASDVEFCYYEGTAFQTSQETKQVKVISPGWVYKDKNIQISRPKVKEES